MCLRALILPVTHLSLFHRCACLCASVSLFTNIKFFVWLFPSLCGGEKPLHLKQSLWYRCWETRWLLWIVFLWLPWMSAVLQHVTNYKSTLLLFWKKGLSLTYKQPLLVDGWSSLNSNWKQCLTSVGWIKAPDCSLQEKKGNANMSLCFLVWAHHCLWE